MHNMHVSAKHARAGARARARTHTHTCVIAITHTQSKHTYTQKYDADAYTQKYSADGGCWIDVDQFRHMVMLTLGKYCGADCVSCTKCDPSNQVQRTVLH